MPSCGLLPLMAGIIGLLLVANLWKGLCANAHEW